MASQPSVPRATPRSLPRRAMLQYVSLLYSVFFFVQPIQHPSLAGWLWFAGFYLSFLALYFAIPAATGWRQLVLLALFFALGFGYFPFNSSAAGIFVYPVVLLALVAPRVRVFLPILAAQIAAILIETSLLHLPLLAAEGGIFFSVVIGLSNLLYFQEQDVNLQLQAANIQIAQLTQAAERERIARDLHDLLGHTLTLITIKLDLARRLLPEHPDRAKTEVTEAGQTARNALADVREAVAGYRSQGLAAELARMRATLQAAKIEMTTAIAPIALPQPQIDVLCLVLREAVTNILRHTSATTCHVQFAAAGPTLQFSVTDSRPGDDDGRDLAVGAPGESREGSGLRGMRERLAALGGSLQVTRTAHGTRLLAALPAA
jgi:two-component system sensor histidine kinase DesK